jgi:EmrB/QacA subfamily drug resistance transporter
MTTVMPRQPGSTGEPAELPTPSESAVQSPPAGGPLSSGPGALSHRQILVVMSGLMLGLFLATLDQTIVGVALPTIVGEFHRADLLSWVITAYLLTSTISTPLFGKASDLFGRKRLLQLSIVIFLVGSALCGLAQNMAELIGFRALQGVGAGGLLSLTLAVVADIIPARERGRYQGYFGAVFASSSVIGPLLGGFFVDQATWRWCFYINIPLGLAALIVINRVLHIPFTARRVEIDWAGAALLVAGVSALLLAVQMGGRDFAWTSPQLLSLVAAGLLLVVGFVVRERVAPEPILPPRLFRNGTFRVASSIGFLSGAVMFGVIIFLPQYLQLVRGESATVSGLTTIPMLGGMLLTSITSGRLISRIGRYKIFVVAGTCVLTLGIALMTQLSATTPLLTLAAWMFIMGAGMGMFMQTVVIATQSSVESRDLGVATSSVMFFRSMGGAIGAAAFGALLTSRLIVELPRHLPAGVAHAVGKSSDKLVSSPDAVKALAPVIRHGVGIAYSNALSDVFLAALPLAVITMLVSFVLPEIKLRSTNGIQRAAAESDEPVFTEGAVI